MKSRKTKFKGSLKNKMNYPLYAYYKFLQSSMGNFIPFSGNNVSYHSKTVRTFIPHMYFPGNSKAESVRQLSMLRWNIPKNNILEFES